MNEGSSYYEMIVVPISSISPSRLCHTLSEEKPVLQIGDKGILYTKSCTIRLDKSVFEFKGNIVNSRVQGPSIFPYLTNLNIKKEIISSRFTNESSSSVIAIYLIESSSTDSVIVNVSFLASGSSRPYAGTWESGTRVYITENTYIRMMSSTGFSIVRMYNNF